MQDVYFQETDFPTFKLSNSKTVILSMYTTFSKIIATLQSFSKIIATLTEHAQSYGIMLYCTKKEYEKGTFRRFKIKSEAENFIGKTEQENF